LTFHGHAIGVSKRTAAVIADRDEFVADIRPSDFVAGAMTTNGGNDYALRRA
jgi:hypothetical protein